MFSVIFKNFINLNSFEKELILTWRNSDRVRLKMLNQDIIALEQHLKWIDNLKNKRETLYYLFLINDIPVGVFDYTEIVGGKCVCGSYIGNEDFIGYGILLNYLGFEYAFNNLGIKRIDISVLKTNKRVYKMHKTIFYALDIGESEDEFFLYFDRDIWFEKRELIKKSIEKAYGNVLTAIWE